MEYAYINPDELKALPFSLPDTAQSVAWLSDLDQIDLTAGPLTELELLARNAPSTEARAFISGVLLIRKNERLQKAQKVYQVLKALSGKPLSHYPTCDEIEAMLYDGLEVEGIVQLILFRHEIKDPKPSKGPGMS